MTGHDIGLINPLHLQTILDIFFFRGVLFEEVCSFVVFLDLPLVKMTCTEIPWKKIGYASEFRYTYLKKYLEC